MQTSCALITYNCAKSLQAVSAVSEILNEALRHDGSPQLIVFCLQEVSSIMDASMGWTDQWLAPFASAVPANYRPIGKAVSGAVAVLAFASPEWHYKSVSYDTLAFGLLWSSLKGAAMLVIEGGSSNEKLSFISAHLAANEGYKEQRDRDLRYLIEHFGVARLGGQVFIGGDLNYRTTDGSFATDELNLEMQKNGTVHGFVETTVNFDPTFKFHPRTLKYNPKRTASYCDRILFRALDGVAVVKYESVMLAELDSDHKPVYLVISTPTKAPMPALTIAASDSDDPSSVNHLLADASMDDDVEEEDDANSSEGTNSSRDGHIKQRQRRQLLPVKWQKVTAFIDLFIGSGIYTFTMPRGRIGLGLGIGLLLLAWFVL